MQHDADNTRTESSRSYGINRAYLTLNEGQILTYWEKWLTIPRVNRFELSLVPLRDVRTDTGGIQWKLFLGGDQGYFSSPVFDFGLRVDD